jgi:general secretion pathway protein C
MFSLDINKIRLPADISRWLLRSPPAVNVLMVLAVAYSLAILTWKLVPSPALVETPDLPLAATQNTPLAQPVTNLRNLAAMHLFGEATVAPIAPPEPVMSAEAPDTSLSLTLLGVISGGIRAWAIIGDRMGNEETYTINSPLPGGAVLKEIYRDRVILLYNNRYETLRLPQDDLGEGAAPSHVSSAPQFSSSGPVTRMGSEVSQVLRSYKQQLLNDPQSLMDVVRAEPYRQGGQIRGYRIFPGRDKKVMDQVGLIPGDVVTAINGIDLDSPIKGLEVMQQITDASEVSVNVLRNGVNQTFVVPLN